LLFIDPLSFSPISSPENPDYIDPKGKSNSHYAVIYATDTIESSLLTPMAYIFCNDTARVEKSTLGQGKGDIVFGLVLPVFFLVPLKASLPHEDNILETD